MYVSSVHPVSGCLPPPRLLTIVVFPSIFGSAPFLSFPVYCCCCYCDCFSFAGESANATKDATWQAMDKLRNEQQGVQKVVHSCPHPVCRTAFHPPTISAAAVVDICASLSSSWSNRNAKLGTCPRFSTSCRSDRKFNECVLTIFPCLESASATPASAISVSAAAASASVQGHKRPNARSTPASAASDQPTAVAKSARKKVLDSRKKRKVLANSRFFLAFPFARQTDATSGVTRRRRLLCDLKDASEKKRRSRRRRNSCWLLSKRSFSTFFLLLPFRPFCE